MEIERMKRSKLILTPVKELPKREYNSTWQHDMIGTLEAFESMACKIAQVKIDEFDFANIDVARRALDFAIREHSYPFKVCIRNGGLYLIKKNIT